MMIASRNPTPRWCRSLSGDRARRALTAIAVDVVNQAQVAVGDLFGVRIKMAIKQGATRAEIEKLLLFMWRVCWV
jgi:hypothetical protein